MSKRNRERRAAGASKAEVLRKATLAGLRPQVCRSDSGETFEHLEAPSRSVQPVRMTGWTQGFSNVPGFENWTAVGWYGTLRRYEDGLPDQGLGAKFGSGPCAVIGISADGDTAAHDWRAFQEIKNALVGDEWEAVELYPAESRKVDPSNHYYLFCFPKGVFSFGWAGRNVKGPQDGGAPQRPFA